MGRRCEGVVEAAKRGLTRKGVCEVGYEGGGQWRARPHVMAERVRCVRGPGVPRKLKRFTSREIALCRPLPNSSAAPLPLATPSPHPTQASRPSTRTHNFLPHPPPSSRPLSLPPPRARPSRVSFFEPKLDFWRQLWRVLERSDVAVMIVDARNPLLHFSEALVRAWMSACVFMHMCVSKQGPRLSRRLIPCAPPPLPLRPRPTPSST